MADRRQPGPLAEIRELREEDLDALLDLTEAVAQQGWIGRESPIDRDGLRQQYEGVLAGPEKPTLVLAAEVEGALVGTLHIVVEPHRVGGLGMMVAESWRGVGIGSALLERAINWAHEQGAHKVALQMWPHNERGRALYEKFGFVEEGLLRAQYRRRNGELWDAVAMGLVLDHERLTGP